MTASRDNSVPFLPPLPPGLDEVDLLAWLEGDGLPRNREVAVARLLSEHPPLARRLEAMRKDRDALRAMSADERAPAGLLQGVQAALQPVLERQMLLGLQDGPLVEDHPPVSLVIPRRRSAFDILLRDRAGRRMALAAGLLLLIGGTTYMAAVMFSGGPRQPSEIGPLARGPDDQGNMTALRGPDPTETFDEPAHLAEATGLADPADDSAAASALAANAESVLGVEAPGAAVALNDGAGGDRHELAPAATNRLTTAEALRLAEANRLVVRVRLGQGLARMEPVVDRLRRNSSGWRYGGEAPPALASALVRPVHHVDDTFVRPGEVMVADVRGAPRGALYGPPAPRPMLELPRPRAGVYMVQSRLDEGSLESLRTALAGVAGEVWFEQVEEGMEAPIESSPSLAPSAVLWWGQPPSAWTWWCSVPVVIEPGR